MSESRDDMGSARLRRRERGEAARLRRLGGVASVIAPEVGARDEKGEARGDGDRSSPTIVTSPVLGSRQKKAKGRARRPGASTSVLWAKAQVAAQSSKALIERGDTDGAANRAYYATFGAARAALASVRAALARSKGHGTIFRRFAKHVVEERGFDRSLGRSFFHKQSHARWVADYDEGQVDEATARLMISEMDRFLAAVEPFLKRPKR